MRVTLAILILSLLVAISFSDKQPVEAFGNKALTSFLYVNNNDFSNSVTVFSINNSNGQLRAISGSPFFTNGSGGKKSNVGGLSICKKTRRLYVTNNADNTISAFQINSNGSLTLLGNPVFSGGNLPTGITVNKQGTRLFVANVGSDSIASFVLDKNGYPFQQVNNSPFIVGNGPIDMELNPNGNILYVNLQFSHTLSSFQIDNNGALLPITNFITPGLTNHGLTLNQKTSTLYVAELGNNSISGYQTNLGTGSLTTLFNNPFFTNGSQPLDIVTNKAGSFVYVSNNDNSTISVFSVAQNGTLFPIFNSPFVSDSTGPAGLVINRRGTFLFVANGGFTASSDVSVFKINANGSLSNTFGSPYFTGTFGTPTAIGLFETPVGK